jgi:stage II sporulation protein D
VVRYAGRIAVTYFSSSSGGHTESVQNVFYGAPPTPYLRGVKDPYDGSAPRHSWRLAFTPAEVQSRLHGLVKGGFQGIQVVRRGSSRRVVWADVVGTGGRTRVRGVTIEGRLGLYDTWADFPALGGGGKRVAAQPAARAPQATPPAPPAPRPAPPHRADGDGFGWPGTAWAAAG